MDNKTDPRRGEPASAQPFTERQRRAFMSRYCETLAQYRETDPDDETRHDGLRDLLGSLWDAYSESVPYVALSRCPVSRRVAYHSFDPWGLDGLWWDADSPARPVEQQLPTYFALTGAMQLAEPVEDTPFLCKPGPGAPFVVPRLLEESNIRAVVSSTPVGRHTAFPIFYFVDGTAAVERVNTWGMNHYTLLDELGWQRWGEVPERAEDFDFDLTRWLERGKLLWIEPGDRSLELREGVEGCPFIEIDGVREPQRAQGGEIWT
jgi:hypothetical protein